MSKLQNSREKLPDDRRIYLSRLNARAKVETHSKIRGHYKHLDVPDFTELLVFGNMTEIQEKTCIQVAEHQYGFIFGRNPDFENKIQAPLKALSRKLWRNAWSTKIACVNYGFSSRPKYLDQIG
ncbi:hypothetical protein C8J57DRAFT_1257402 [Mycena rebaudengoi]|nr:hypothetical protein C8J57DRAFT_1257402 [Mycena rebaudengoi]